MKWELAVPWILSLLTAALGIWQFSAQQSQANRRPFLEQQLAIGVEITETAARLATETDPVKWTEDRATFWRLYWGRLALVEDREVESSMVQMGELIPKGPITANALPTSQLEIPAYELSHAVRGLILESWNVDLPPLKGR